MRKPDSDSGQSEPLGFLLIFSVVLLAILLVGATGFTGLEQTRDFQRTATAEEAFSLLATNMDDVLREGAPSRSTEIGLTDAVLSLDTAETNVTIAFEDGSTSDATVETHPIVYDSGSGTRLTYHNGALIRRDDGSAVMLRPPGFVLTQETVVIPIVATIPEERSVISGDSTVAVRIRRTGSTLLASGAPVDSVTLGVNTSQARVWARYFEQFESGGPVTTVNRTGTTLEVTMQSDRATLTIHEIVVEFH